MCNCGGPKYKPPQPVRVQRAGRRKRISGGISEIIPPTDPIANYPGITPNPTDVQRTQGSKNSPVSGASDDPVQGS